MATFELKGDDRPRCYRCDALCFVRDIQGKRVKEVWCSDGCHILRGHGEPRYVDLDYESMEFSFDRLL